MMCDESGYERGRRTWFCSHSFDYGEKFWIIKCKSFTCTCGAESCRYSETTIRQTLDNYNKRLLQDELMQQSELQLLQ
ncbi:hypothetical protein C0J52_08775 [Blattella germanica]|nr:hypothetical protein C0J52_08775 [Blattella germanica]